MKQIVLVLLAFSFLTAAINGQTIITIDPIPAEANFEVDLSDNDLDLEIKATITNTSDMSVALKWLRQELDKPEAWETQVCDNNQCYLPQVSTNYNPDIGIEEPMILAAGASFELIFHVLPRGVAGEGEFTLAFTTIENQETVLETGIFKVNVSPLTVSTNEPIRKGISVFPNPADNYIELNNGGSVDQLIIYNIIGRKIRTFQVSPGKKYNVADLPAGLYLVSLIDSERGIVRTLRMSKRTIKP